MLHLLKKETRERGILENFFLSLVTQQKAKIMPLQPSLNNKCPFTNVSFTYFTAGQVSSTKHSTLWTASQVRQSPQGARLCRKAALAFPAECFDGGMSRFFLRHALVVEGQRKFRGACPALAALSKMRMPEQPHPWV